MLSLSVRVGSVVRVSSDQNSKISGVLLHVSQSDARRTID